jgi:hypothetical protein
MKKKKVKQLRQSDFGFFGKIRPLTTPEIARGNSDERVSHVRPLLFGDRPPLGWKVRAVDIDAGMWRVEVVEPKKKRVHTFECASASREDAIETGNRVAWLWYHRRYAKTKRGGDYVFGG